MLGLLVSLAFAEATLRVATKTDDSGGQRIFGVDLLPAPPPPLRELVSEYTQYDPACGWSPRPLGSTANGLYCADQHGLRAPAPAERTPPPGAVPVMLTGDSFAHSDEVSYEESLGVAIERARPGTWAQIAGVQAFGIDQAYLRYRSQKAALRPRVAVIGAHQNDFMRNVALWTKSGFSKPRFVLAEDGSLDLINHPPMKPAEFVRVFDDFENSDLAPHQFFHAPGYYEDRATDGVRVLRFLRSFRARLRKRHAYQETVRAGARNEVHLVARAIVEAFAREVIEDGAVPIVVTLPSSAHLEYLRQDNDWWSWSLRGAAESAGCAYVDITTHLRDDVDSGRMAMDEIFTRGGTGHYTAAGNRRVADLLLPALDEAIRAIGKPRGR